MGFLDNQGLATLWNCIVVKIGDTLGTVKSFSSITTKSGSTVTTVEAPNQAAGFTIEAGDNITLVTNAATNTIKIIGADAPEAPEASLEALGISATPTEINHLAGASSNIQNQLNAKVPTTRKVNGKVLSSDITLSASDVGAAAEGHKHNASDINAGVLDAARLPNISIDKLIAGTTNTTIPSSLLPAYVDDVLEYAAKANFPTTGETGKIYVDKTTNLTWRWSGSAYVEISPSLALGTTSSTAHRGDHGAAAYTHSQSAHAPSNAQKNSDITKAEIEAKLTGKITSHTHDYVANLGDLGITATATELNYVDGVTSDIQTQLNNRWDLTTIGTVIPANTDLNDMKTPGTYYSNQGNISTFKNCPATTGFKMVVMRGYSDGRYHQHLYPGGSTPNYHFRTFNGTTWSNWVNFTDKTPAEHTHDYVPTSRTINGKALSSNITLSASDVSAAPASHTHDYLPSTQVQAIYEATSNDSLNTIINTIYDAMSDSTRRTVRIYMSATTDIGGGTWIFDFNRMTADWGAIEGITYETNSVKKRYRSKRNGSWDSWTNVPYHTHSEYYHINENGTAIAKNTNLNDLTTPGNYTCTSGNNSGLSNCPMSSGGFKLVTIRGYSDNYFSQFIMAGASNKYYYRTRSSGGTWTAWVDLSNKDFLPTTGGTLTGNLYVAKSGESDLGVNYGTSKNLYLYGNNSSGARGLYDTDAGSVILINGTTKTFYGSLSGNASTATDATNATNITQTLKEDAAANTNWYPLCGTTNTTGTRGTVFTKDFRIQSYSGTTSVAGEVEMILGNATATGTAGNKHGFITLYSPGTSYHAIKGTSVSSACTHTLPAYSGTFHTTGSVLYSSTQPTGTFTGQIWLKPV